VRAGRRLAARGAAVADARGAAITAIARSRETRLIDYLRR
jgi:hypothetical protein